MKHKQNGFSIVESLIIIVVVGVIGFAGYTVYSKVNENESSSSTQSNATQASLSTDGQNGSDISSWQSGCSGEGSITLTHSPMDMRDVGQIVPLGSYAGEHVTPIDHLYYYPNDFQNNTPYQFPVYAMGDGKIVKITTRTYNADTPEEYEEYRLIIQHTCTFFTYFDLVRKLDDSIAKQLSSLDAGGGIPITAGQEIGRIGGQSLDTAAYDIQKPLSGFISPDLYESTEFWKQYTADFFSYFDPDVRDEMLVKNARTAEPRSGKIDHDQPGKLIGNWFVKGTNGYAGRDDIPKENYLNGGGQGSWTTHLALAPDPYKPEYLVASLGDYEGEAKQFSIKGNVPDFASVDRSSGVVKYELIKQKIFGSTDPIQIAQSKEDGPVLGTMLVQVMPDEELKFEVFPGKTVPEVSGFTSEAITYER